MISRIVASMLLAGALVAAPLAAMSQTDNRTVSIARSAGTCPKSIAVTVVTKQYPGGFTMDYTAQTAMVASNAKVVAATPQRIAFNAALNAAYKSCEGTGKSGDVAFMLHKGNLSYVISPGKGPNNTYPGALHMNVVKGLPNANMSITD
jgi:hypothetical protein